MAADAVIAAAAAADDVGGDADDICTDMCAPLLLVAIMVGGGPGIMALLPQLDAAEKMPARPLAVLELAAVTR